MALLYGFVGLSPPKERPGSSGLAMFVLSTVRGEIPDDLTGEGFVSDGVPS
jgi:hypothetical protein